MTDRVLILDFGSQVTQLIARRVRESGVYCEIHPFAMSPERLRQFAPKAIILSGGPASVHEAGTPRAPDAVFELGVPVLGICYGQMTMAAQLGGTVEASSHREFGRAFVDVTGECALFQDEPRRPHHRDAAGLFRRRHQRGRAFRRHRRRPPQILRPDVPSRSGAHAARRGAAAKLHAQGRRLWR
jgi:GMP synthase-like glutamine amidotransferase